MNLNKLIGGHPPKDINEIIRESIKLRAPFQHFATVMIQEPDGIIKGIGQSKRNNLILDSFGQVLAALMRAPINGITNINLDDITDTARACTIMEEAAGSNSFIGSAAARIVGTVMRCGSGVTPAVRTNFEIETPLAVAPEDAIFPTGNGSYAAGSVGCSGTIVAGGAGTINEVGMYGQWVYAGPTLGWFMLFHDILVAGEAYVLGETITVTYTLAL